MIALIVIASIVGYLVTAGIVGGVGWHKMAIPADKLDYADDNFGVGVASFFGGLFWPVTLPVFLGLWIAQAPVRHAGRKRAAEVAIRQLERELDITDPKGPWDY